MQHFSSYLTENSRQGLERPAGYGSLGNESLFMTGLHTVRAEALRTHWPYPEDITKESKMWCGDRRTLAHISGGRDELEWCIDGVTNTGKLKHSRIHFVQCSVRLRQTPHGQPWIWTRTSAPSCFLHKRTRRKNLRPHLQILREKYLMCEYALSRANSFSENL